MGMFDRKVERKQEGGIDAVVGGTTDMPLVVSARTGLTGKDEALVRRVPVDYAGKTLREVISYVTGDKITDSELPYAKSIQKELGASGSVVMANGQQADLDRLAGEYIVQREHRLPNGGVKKYQELEIEVSAVQQGGYLGF